MGEAVGAAQVIGGVRAEVLERVPARDLVVAQAPRSRRRPARSAPSASLSTITKPIPGCPLSVFSSSGWRESISSRFIRCSRSGSEIRPRPPDASTIASCSESGPLSVASMASAACPQHDLAVDELAAGGARQRAAAGVVLVAGVGERAADAGQALVGRLGREDLAVRQSAP